MRPARRALLLVPLCTALVAGTAFVALRSGDSAPDTLQTSSETPSLPALPTPAATAVPTVRPTALPTRVLPTPPACPSPQELPAADRTWTLTQEAHLPATVTVQGTRLWFGEDDMKAGPAPLVRVDLGSGQTHSLPLKDRLVSMQRIGDVAWMQTMDDVVRVDLAGERETGRWTPQQLVSAKAGGGPFVVSVEATPDALYALVVAQDGHPWLSDLDPGSGRLRWSWRVPVRGPSQWSNGRGYALAAGDEGAYVALPSGERSGVRVWHLDPAGRVVADVRVPARAMPYDLPRLLVGPEGLYVTQVLPVGAVGDDRGALLRLDLGDLTLLSRLDGWERRRTQVGPSGLWSEGRGCGDDVLSHHDPRTLAVDREYRVPEGTVTFDLSGSRPVLVRQTTDAARTAPLEIDLLPSL